MKYYYSFLSLLLILVSLVTFTRGVILTRCILAKALYERNVPKDDLNKWVCIAQHESSFNTRAVGPTNKNRSRDWGIFQINDKYWCQPPSGNFSYNECKINCSDLLTDDISASVKCALKIKKQQGWTAWSTWKFTHDMPQIILQRLEKAIKAT